MTAATSGTAQRRPSLPPLPPLPVDAVRRDVEKALAEGAPFLLEAPPGTGKSTRVPLWAMEALEGRVLLLEPRRVAARLLARHLAGLAGCALGETVGLAMRAQTRMCAATRLLVVTEGVFTRMIREDQALSGISCVLFDEFHERSLSSDTGLALALESRAILRPDLRLGVLSATLDVEAIAAVLPDAPVIRATCRAWPVAVVHAPDRTPGLFSMEERLRALPRHMARIVLGCLAREPGSLLAFLPGAREIRRTAELLDGRLPENCDLFPLLGRLDAREQDRALAPSPAGRRKVVLATDIAETSLTIRGVRIVVDSGLQRRSRFDPGCGSSRLETRAIPLSSARQRCGRAGRLEPGLCVELWSEEAEPGMAPHARPEILECDLDELALDLALWGSDPQDMAFVTQPPRDALERGSALLRRLGALDGDGRATTLGRELAALGTRPREGAVLLAAARSGDLAPAALACALIEELAGAGAHEGPADLTIAADRLAAGRPAIPLADIRVRAQHLAAQAARAAGAATLPKGALAGEGIERAARRLAGQGILGRLLLPGFADGLCRRQEAGDGKAAAAARQQPMQESTITYVRADGRRLLVPATDALARSRFVLALSTRAAQGTSGRARLDLGCPLGEEDVLSGRAGPVGTGTIVQTGKDGRVTARLRRTIGAIVLAETPVPVEDTEEVRTALCDLVAREGLRLLPLDDAARAWLARARFLARTCGSPWPDMGDETLLARVREWLPGALHGTDLRRVAPKDLVAAWRRLLPPACARDMDRLAPAAWQAPSGRSHPIAYTDDGPVVETKLQECFGLSATPSLPCGATLVVHLLSPAGAPLAVTRDLAYFWREVYPGVRAQMRGRYPKHPWPEDPLAAQPTALTRKRLEARSRQA